MIVAILFCGLGMVLASCTESSDNTEGNNDTPSDEPWVDRWKTQKAKYTLMFYGCGGSDVDIMLEYAIYYIAQELNVSSDQVRVTVMYSMSKDFSKYAPSVSGRFLGEPATTYRYEMVPDMNATREAYSEYKYKNASDVKLYSAQTLADFISWSKQTAPADNYILMPTNHGGGFDLNNEVLTRAIGYDDNHAFKPISQATVAEALKMTGTHLKAIYWYGCLMGQAEVMTEVADYCDYQFCSAHVSRADYTIHPSHLIRALNKYPNDFEMAAQEHYKLMEADYSEPFAKDTDGTSVAHPENADWGCWRSSRLAEINKQVKLLADKIKADYANPATAESIANAIKRTYQFEYDMPHVDLLDFANMLYAYTQDAAYQPIVDGLEQAIDAACVYHVNVILRKYGSGQLIQPYLKRFTLGVSIYGPKDTDPLADKERDLWNNHNANYKATLFDKATGWSQWLENNNTAVSRMGRNPCNDSRLETYWLED